ncbi:MAG TPA: hypothetical protein EYF98_11775 [Planctomycetes bacterium]|nr:hypothetical protein [Planctomycetota bacterium]
MDLSPVQVRIVTALLAHDRALLLTPLGAGAAIAILAALPSGSPVMWVASEGIPELFQDLQYFIWVRPEEVTHMCAEDVAGGTLVVADAGQWLAKDSFEALCIRSLALKADRVWGYDNSLSRDLGLLHKIKHHLGMEIAPNALFDGVIALGWAPTPSAPEPLLKPVVLDEVEE